MKRNFSLCQYFLLYVQIIKYIYAAFGIWMFRFPKTGGNPNSLMPTAVYFGGIAAAIYP